MTEIHVQDIMIKNVITTSITNTAAFAAKKMAQKNTGMIVIMKDHNPVGVVTRKDLVNKIRKGEIKRNTQ